MVKKVIWLVCMAVCCITAKPQHNSPKPVKKSCSCALGSINQLGMLRGETSSYFQFQTINGIHYKTWFAGLGAGMDFYRIKSIPVFIDLRKDILGRLYTPFVYADGGLNFSGLNNKHDLWSKTMYNDGFFYD